MWIFTPGGFLSVVAHDDDERCLLVRGRWREDLERFLTMGHGCTDAHAAYAEGSAPAGPPPPGGPGIVECAAADYRYRVVVFRTHFAQWMTRRIAALDYGNFKNAASLQMGHERTRPLHDIWMTLLRAAGGGGKYGALARMGADAAKLRLGDDFWDNGPGTPPPPPGPQTKKNQRRSRRR